MDHYAEAKIAMELEEDKLDKINKESIDLDNKTNKVSDKLKTLKQNPITKNYSLSQEEKENIENYVSPSYKSLILELVKFSISYPIVNTN